jgi:hypothetical protein
MYCTAHQHNITRILYSVLVRISKILRFYKTKLHLHINTPNFRRTYTMHIILFKHYLEINSELIFINQFIR